jgi:membrane protease YdiL (CAAX protease family)
LPAVPTDQALDTGTARREPVPIAPLWHTAILIAVIIGVATTGTLLRPSGAPSPSPASAGSRITTVYLPMVIVQWGLALYVCRIARPRSALGPLLGERWKSPRRAAVDVALALAGWLLIQAFELAWARLLGQGAPASVLAVLPHTWLERVAWVVVSVSAGFCEEVVYRGYLQTQLTAFTRRAGVAVVLQAALFGIAHGEQGARAIVRVALYGLAFGALARWRRSLWPGIVCHAWTDLASGLLR